MPKDIIKQEEKAIVSFNAETLIAQAIDKNVPIETMQKLLDMRRELKAEWAKGQFDKAMAAFQGTCPVIKKSKSVANKDKSVRYKYAPLDEIVRQIGKKISDNGLSYTITAKVEENKTIIATVKVTHVSGYSQDSSFQIPIDSEGFMTQPQKFASALTYAKRYAFCNAFGILTGDEDNDSMVTGKVDEDKTQKAFQMLKSSIGKATVKELKEFATKMKASDKYTEEQKNEFLDLVDIRIHELAD